MESKYFKEMFLGNTPKTAESEFPYGDTELIKPLNNTYWVLLVDKTLIKVHNDFVLEEGDDKPYNKILRNLFVEEKLKETNYRYFFRISYNNLAEKQIDLIYDRNGKFFHKFEDYSSILQELNLVKLMPSIHSIDFSALEEYDDDVKKEFFHQLNGGKEILVQKEDVVTIKKIV